MSDEQRFKVGDTVCFVKHVEYHSFGGDCLHVAHPGNKSRIISMWNNGYRLSCGIRLPFDTDVMRR